CDGEDNDCDGIVDGPGCGACQTDNGGCGDSTYVACSDTVGGTPECDDLDECATENGGCGDPSVMVCRDMEGEPPTCHKRWSQVQVNDGRACGLRAEGTFLCGGYPQGNDPGGLYAITP